MRKLYFLLVAFLCPLPVLGQNLDLEALKASVVKITSKAEGEPSRIGTGFIVAIDEDIVYIATASHVVEGDRAPKVEFFFRLNRQYPATVGRTQGGDPKGFAYLSVTDKTVAAKVKALRWSLEPLKQLEEVVLIGFGQGQGDWGVITGKVANIDGTDIIIDAATQEGNSGGPIFRKNGSVVGMITSARTGRGIGKPANFVTGTLKGWRVPVAIDDGATQQAERATPALKKEPESKTTVLKAGQTFKDCNDCPEMVVVPAGRFMMGSPDTETGRTPNESPQHQVTIPAAFAVSKFEITRGQFARFVRATGRVMSGGCWVWDDDKGEPTFDRASTWLNPGFPQGDDHPAVCVGFEDATAYVEWLTGQTGEAYRLLSEAEWEYAARAGKTTARFWGDGEQQACRYANVGDRSGKRKYRSWNWTTFDCDDGFAETAPKGNYKANAFGLQDMLGNVSEWVQDCWNEGYQGAPMNGSAWLSGRCEERVLRGGSWIYFPAYVRSAFRNRFSPSYRNFIVSGIRLARTLP